MLKQVVMLTIAVMMGVDADARVRIDLTDPNADPMPIALSAFAGSESAENDMGAKMRGVIENNLKNTALFAVADEKAHLQSPQAIRKDGIAFHDWRLLKVGAVLTGRIEQTEGGKMKIQFRLYDPYTESQVIGKSYSADVRFWRHIAHRVSDDIYTALTGEKPYFTTRIVHIGEEKGFDGVKMKKLCVMDQDGGNYQCLTNGDHLVLTPRFNPAVQKIVYMSYAKGVPRLYMLDLPTGKQEIVGDFEGLNSSPRFSPDGKSLIMTLTKGHAGNPEVYKLDLTDRTLTRLTFHRGIDTSPSFSPDGKHIVFNSNRGGKPSLYIMNADGSQVRRLTFGGARYYAPVWSPRGDLIAFVKEQRGRFSIGVIDPEGDEERQLTESFMDESPTWSPNGRVIIFARQMGDRNRLYTIDLTGYNERQLPTPNDASDPAWSPLLK